MASLPSVFISHGSPMHALDPGAAGKAWRSLGRHLPKIRRTLARIGRLDHAIYVERGSTKAAVMMRLADKPDDTAPYFAIVLLPGWGERP